LIRFFASSLASNLFPVFVVGFVMSSYREKFLFSAGSLRYSFLSFPLPRRFEVTPRARVREMDYFPPLCVKGLFFLFHFPSFSPPQCRLPGVPCQIVRKFLLFPPSSRLGPTDPLFFVGCVLVLYLIKYRTEMGGFRRFFSPTPRDPPLYPFVVLAVKRSMV